MTLLSAEKVQVEWIAVLSQANRGLVEERCPLEGRTVKALALRAVAVLGVDRIAVVFEFDCDNHPNDMSCSNENKEGGEVLCVS